MDSSSKDTDSRKKALVTGASEGIGRAFATRLAREGYKVTAVARNEARLKDLMTTLSGESRGQQHVTHDYLVADLTTSEGVSKVEASIASGAFDLLVNNAGFGHYGTFADSPVDKQRDMVRLNCDTLLALSHAYLKTARRGDALVNVASLLAFLPLPGSAVYAATKAFVASLSDALWYEQKDKGVYVMALCPGSTKSEFHARAGGREGQVPEAMMPTAAAVVSTAMRALAKRSEPIVISGATNRIMAGFARLMPWKTTATFMGAMAPKPS